MMVSSVSLGVMDKGLLNLKYLKFSSSVPPVEDFISIEKVQRTVTIHESRKLMSKKTNKKASILPFNAMKF